MSNVPVYFQQGGAELVVGNGGMISVEEGGLIDTYDTAVTSATGVNFVGSNIFVSSVQTGNGMAQDIAHNLQAVPLSYVIIPQVVPMGAGGEFSAVIDAMATDDENIVCTVTDQVDYQVIAWA